MAAPLNIIQAFGARSDVRDGLHYFDDTGTTIVYPAGHNVIIHDLERKTQKFINGAERSGGLCAMTVSTNRRYLAIAETGDKATVAVLDLISQRKKKSLTLTDVTAKTVVSMSFSSDGKVLLVQAGAPDWQLIYWNWEKGKVLAGVQSSDTAQTSPISQCSISPADPNICCVSGEGIFKLFRQTDGTLKQIQSSTGRKEPQNYLCHAWVSNDKLVVGTDNGELLVFEMGELKVVLPHAPEDKHSIDCIIPWSKGFICGGDGGSLQIYERCEDEKELFTQKAKFKIELYPVKIRSMVLSPNEERVLCALENNQVFDFPLAVALSGKDFQPEHLLQSHSHYITGMDCCIRKPLVATCSTDRTVRVWNYVTIKLELVRSFPEEAYSIALHPSGLHALVGFSDKLRLMNILANDIKRYHEFDIRSCRECRFSNGGQYFAAVAANPNPLIQIYSTYTFENLGTLRGHNGKIRSICWSPDDTKIVSAGVDGAVYEWVLGDFKRKSENVNKTCAYTSVVCTEAARSIFAVGSDKKLKEISDGQVTRKFDSTVCLTQLALSSSGRMLFGGTETGSLRSYKFPLTGEFMEVQCHSAPVSRLRVSFDDRFLFSASEDGSLYILEIRDKEGRGRAVKEIEFSEETLVTRQEMEEKAAKMAELQRKCDELALQHEYQIKLRDLNFAEKKKELKEKLKGEVDAWRLKWEAQRAKKKTLKVEFEKTLKALKEKHESKLAERERKYQSKLVTEVERYTKLVEDKERMEQQWERQMEQLHMNHQAALRSLAETHAKQLEEERQRYNKLKEERDAIQREFEETRRQLEEDADKEIEEQREVYESKLATERQAALKLKGDHGAMKKRFLQIQKEIDDHKESIAALLEEKRQLNDTLQAQIKEGASLRQELSELNAALTAKERMIYEFKKKAAELEKLKFVQEHQISELKRQIEPLNSEIATARAQIKDMEAELERYNKSVASMDLNITDLTMKVEGQSKEIAAQRQRAVDAEAAVRRLRNDVHEVAQYIQDPRELKEAVKRLYHKYVVAVNGSVQPGLEVDIQREYTRQREYLERSVASLRKKLSKDSELYRQDNQRIMQENVQLIKEINILRRELKQLKAQREHEILLPTRKGTRAAARQQPANDSADDHDPAADWHEELREKELQMQREEIKRLRARIAELEALVHSPRPYSREKLPPMEGFVLPGPVSVAGLPRSPLIEPSSTPPHAAPSPGTRTTPTRSYSASLLVVSNVRDEAELCT